MENIKNVITPISSIVDINSICLVEGAKAQLRNMTLGELILITDDFHLHNRLNQVGEVRIKALRDAVEKTAEYKSLMKK